MYRNTASINYHLVDALIKDSLLMNTHHHLPGTRVGEKVTKHRIRRLLSHILSPHGVFIDSCDSHCNNCGSRSHDTDALNIWID